MKNYCYFTNYDEDGFMMDIFNFMNEEKLKYTLDKYFNELEAYLTNYAEKFKMLFRGSDYDEYYYQCKALIESLNDIKIIINILMERHIDE